MYQSIFTEHEFSLQCPRSSSESAPSFIAAKIFTTTFIRYFQINRLQSTAARTWAQRSVPPQIRESVLRLVTCGREGDGDDGGGDLAVVDKVSLWTDERLRDGLYECIVYLFFRTAWPSFGPCCTAATRCGQSACPQSSTRGRGRRSSCTWEEGVSQEDTCLESNATRYEMFSQVFGIYKTLDNMVAERREAKISCCVCQTGIGPLRVCVHFDHEAELGRSVRRSGARLRDHSSQVRSMDFTV